MAVAEWRGVGRTSPGKPPSEDAALLQGDPAPGAVPHDDVIEDLDPQEGAPGHKPPGQGDVFAGRLRITRRMIVNQQDGGGLVGDRRTKDLAGLCCGRSCNKSRSPSAPWVAGLEVSISGRFLRLPRAAAWSSVMAYSSRRVELAGKAARGLLVSIGQDSPRWSVAR